MADATPAAPAVKSGWKTTEMFLALIGLFLCAWLCYALVGLLPEIVKALPQSTNPMVTSILGLAVSGAITGLGWLAHKIVANYANVRLQLKLGDFLPLPPGDAQPSATDIAASAGATAGASPGTKL